MRPIMRFFSGKNFSDQGLFDNWLTDLPKTNENNPKTQKDVALFVKSFSNDSENSISSRTNCFNTEDSFQRSSKNTGRNNWGYGQGNWSYRQYNLFLTDEISISHEEALKQLEKVKLTETLDKLERVEKIFERNFSKTKQIKKLLKQL